ncbi:Uncharacterized protein conserved in bacteria [Bordetella pertussis]|nr:Uncharacterized protein conserved in bacteria [Bordetella pertussis]
MNIRKWGVGAVLGLSVATTAWAADFKVGQVEVDDLWVRASAPGQATARAIWRSRTTPRLPTAWSRSARRPPERVELHNVVTENGVAQMRQVDGVAVPADGKARLAPGGYHVMFLKLKAPFAEGGEVPATLKFEQAGEVAVKFKVKPWATTPAWRPRSRPHEALMRYGAAARRPSAPRTVHSRRIFAFLTTSAQAARSFSA